MKSSARLSPDLARERRVCERRAEESVMLGVRWCLMVQRPGLSNCDWVHPPPSEGQGKSEKLKSHNQFFVRERASTVRTRAARGLYVMRPSATSGPADMTQVISPQHHSAHAHSQDGNHALYAAASLCSWLAALDDLFFVFFYTQFQSLFPRICLFLSFLQ